jgi:hypothetical protein
MKIRIKTKEEFKENDLWDKEYNVPLNWAPTGSMNYLIGKELEIPGGTPKDKLLMVDNWALDTDDYIVLEENNE